jgi:hypothetical protein
MIHIQDVLIILATLEVLAIPVVLAILIIPAIRVVLVIPAAVDGAQYATPKTDVDKFSKVGDGAHGMLKEKLCKDAIKFLVDALKLDADNWLQFSYMEQSTVV